MKLQMGEETAENQAQQHVGLVYEMAKNALARGGQQTGRGGKRKPRADFTEWGLHAQFVILGLVPSIQGNDSLWCP